MMRGWRWAVVAAVMMSGVADAKIKFDKNFRFPAGQTPRIVVFRPDVQVGSLGVGGVEEANADWTAQGRVTLAHQLEAVQKATGNQVVFLPEQQGEAAQVVANYQALFRAVAGAVVEHKINPLANLPTKKDKFDWTLGPGAARLAQIGGGDYGLFLYTHDAYGTAGRKVMQLLVGGLFGAGMQAGIHVGYAALVDFKTGNLVWFNYDPASGGDPRDEQGAAKRIGELFKQFPAAEGAAPKSVATK